MNKLIKKGIEVKEEDGGEGGKRRYLDFIIKRSQAAMQRVMEA